jgi:hypothetical protein
MAAAIACGLSGLARAETITATLETVDPFVGGDVYVQGIGDVNGAIASIIWQGIPSNPVGFQGTFTAYCIDLNEGINIGDTYTFTTSPIADAPKGAAYPGGSGGPMGLAKATEIQELYGQHYADTLGAGNGIFREAFQLSIWNIVYDTDILVDSGDGTFYAESDVDPTAISIADGWLADAASPADQATYSDPNLIALIGSAGVQDQIVQTTPLSPSVLSGGALMAGLALMRFRKYCRLKVSEL